MSESLQGSQLLFQAFESWVGLAAVKTRSANLQSPRVRCQTLLMMAALALQMRPQNAAPKAPEAAYANDTGLGTYLLVPPF